MDGWIGSCWCTANQVRLLGEVGELGGASEEVLGKEGEGANHSETAVVELLVSQVKVLLGILGLAVGDALSALIRVGLLVEPLVHQGNEEGNLGPAERGEGGEEIEVTGEGGEGSAVALEGELKAGVEVAGEADAVLGGEESEEAKHGKTAVLELLKSVLLELSIVLAELLGVEDGKAGEASGAGTGGIVKGHLHFRPGRASHGLDTSEGESIDGDGCESADSGGGELHVDRGMENKMTCRCRVKREKFVDRAVRLLGLCERG
mmetsp:Transcript_38989/g.76631  ORF Transcript_38989/g.76631 Transcript_38989/m.76631 type:complete len:263 (+) Transcript_38989:960-1748(+)